jgi:hypothetical protein
MTAPDSIVTVDSDTGRVTPPPVPWGWGVEYGPHGIDGRRKALFLDRSRAERAAVDLHGVLVMLFAWPMSADVRGGVDWSGAA